MNYLLLEITDKLGRIIYSIGDTIKNEVFPRIKICVLYPFAKSGIVSAQLAIAKILYEHYWFWQPKNPEKWVEKGVRQNNLFAIVLKGHFCRYKARQIEDEKNLAAENGCANAQYLFAQKCLEHDDLKKGLYWMNKAAHAHKSAWTKDEGYPADRKMAKEWYKKNKNILQIKNAALSGNPKALYDYSEFLMHDSHKRDALHLAHEWHTKAAKAGYPKAMAEEGDFIIHGWAPGTLEDAYEYYTKAYETGYKKSALGLGDCYYYGWGTERSLEKARYYYKIAKKLGFGINMMALKKMTEEDFFKVDCKQALNRDREFYN